VYVLFKLFKFYLLFNYIHLQTDKFLNAERLKFYVLISGNLTLNSRNNEEQLINTCENLDWKRQFGLHLWYKCLPINSIHDALSFYEKSLTENTCVKPLPPYLEDKVSTDLSDSIVYTSTKQIQNIAQLYSTNNSAIFKSFGQNNRKKQIQKEIYDTCFHLIKLYCDENYSLADTISPLAHNSNQLDFRLR
jgi:nuclear pore complex protein Nup98-Nup96